MTIAEASQFLDLRRASDAVLLSVLRRIFSAKTLFWVSFQLHANDDSHTRAKVPEQDLNQPFLGAMPFQAISAWFLTRAECLQQLEVFDGQLA